MRARCRTSRRRAASIFATSAPVAAVRETSIVIAAGLAAIVLKERVGRVRLLGATLVTAGVAVMSVL